MFTQSDPGTRVEKTMSFTRTEFENGLRRLTGTPLRLTSTGAYDLSDAADGFPVACLFEPRPDAVLGGLVRLPRVRVTIDLPLPTPEARLDFMGRFERTFQRGGG